jgi:hypothetical protein
MVSSELIEQIAAEYHAMIKRIALSHESSPPLVEELIQDIYLAIWRALPSFRGDAPTRGPGFYRWSNNDMDWLASGHLEFCDARFRDRNRFHDGDESHMAAAAAALEHA